MREIDHFIGGKGVAGTSGRSGDVFNPNTGEVQAKVSFANKSEVEHAIANAEAAQLAWAATNPQRRARVLFKFLELVQKEFDSLAKLLSSEHGKTIADSKGDIQRGLEVVAIVLLMHGAAVRFWNYALYCGAIAAGVLIFVDLPQPGNYAAVGYRVLWTLCGVGIGVLVMLLAGLLARRTAKRPSQPATQPA